ncbi:MAG TPA: hypothetical protein QGG18_02540, partial [Rhodospirillales bacterium]|nr:hypothetical protein [Rhodospirillales bacterium]
LKPGFFSREKLTRKVLPVIESGNFIRMSLLNVSTKGEIVESCSAIVLELGRLFPSPWRKVHHYFSFKPRFAIPAT